MNFLCAISFVAFLVLLKLYVVVTLGRCKSDCSLGGKTILVTGASKGIGYEASKNFARRGARVIIISENNDEINEAKEKLMHETGNKNIIAKCLDLRSLGQVRQFTEEFLRTEDRLDVLVNNAGTGGLGLEKTEDGILPVLQVNYVAPFLLTNLLLGLLKKSAPSRIVNVSSVVCQTAWINDNNINHCPRFAHHFFQYANSKLCVNLATYEMAERLKGTGITVNCLHPGFLKTKIYENLKSKFVMWATNYVTPFYMKSPEEGAQTTIHLATCKAVEGVTGKYFSDCKERSVWAKTDAKRRRLIWEQSVKLAKLKPDELFLDKNL